MMRLPQLLAAHLVTLWLWLGGSAAQDFGLFGPCAKQNREGRPEGCWDYMRSAAEDPNIFWFGNALEQACSDSTEPRNLSCASNVPEGAPPFSYKTLGSRALNTPDFKSADWFGELTSPMSVVYNSPQEFASGCNSTQGGGQFVFDSHPNLAPLPSFFFRYAPAVNIPACSLARLCTLVFLDANYAVIHNVWPNWPRDNPLLSGYVTPGAQRLEPDPYVWAAFAQAGPIDLPQSEGPSDAYSFDVAQFRTDNNLTGPIALSWLLAIQDVYTNRYLVQFGVPEEQQLATCPNLLESCLNRESSILLRDIGLSVGPQQLTMWLGVRFPPPLFAGRPFAAGGAWADPLANAAIPSELANNRALVYPVARLAAPTGADLMGTKYSLLLVRRDDRAPAMGDPLVLVYWLVINIEITDPGTIKDGDLGNDATVVLGYAGCDSIPLGASGNANFYLLVFAQSGDLGAPDDYVSLACPVPGTALRCRFPLGRWVDEGGLRLVGLSRWRVTPPPPSAHIRVPVFVRPSAAVARRSRRARARRSHFAHSLPRIRW